MNHVQSVLVVLAVMFAVVAWGCSSEAVTKESEDQGSLTASRGEHDRDGEGHDGEEGEESGAELALNEVYDDVRKGVRLMLAYHPNSNSFNGSVENTTSVTLRRVRVEVHLSYGRELGPTTPVDLGPGEKRDVKLTATGKGFSSWTAHPEVGSGEHGHGEGRGEHDEEGRDEHDGAHG